MFWYIGLLKWTYVNTDKIYFQNVELHRIKTEQFAKAVQEVESKFM